MGKCARKVQLLPVDESVTESARASGGFAAITELRSDVYITKMIPISLKHTQRARARAALGDPRR